MYTWIIGKNKEILIKTHTFYDSLENFSYEDLSEYEKVIVNSVLYGNEIILNSFSYFTDEILITAGVLIYNINKNIIGSENEDSVVDVLLVQSIVKSKGFGKCTCAYILDFVGGVYFFIYFV